MCKSQQLFYYLQSTFIEKVCELFQAHELAGQAGFCLEITNEGPRLKRSHKYYAQIQGEMAIMGCSWGDFVVWTAASQSNCFVERINFDVEFCSAMLPKVVEFFVSHILPFYAKH